MHPSAVCHTAASCWHKVTGVKGCTQMRGDLYKRFQALWQCIFIALPSAAVAYRLVFLRRIFIVLPSAFVVYFIAPWVAHG
eukprot:290536-Ditylum_brightwellii.AAC.1